MKQNLLQWVFMITKLRKEPGAVIIEVCITHHIHKHTDTCTETHTLAVLTWLQRRRNGNTSGIQDLCTVCELLSSTASHGNGLDSDHSRRQTWHSGPAPLLCNDVILGQFLTQPSGSQFLYFKMGIRTMPFLLGH